MSLVNCAVFSVTCLVSIVSGPVYRVACAVYLVACRTAYRVSGLLWRVACKVLRVWWRVGCVTGLVSGVVCYGLPVACGVYRVTCFVIALALAT